MRKAQVLLAFGLIVGSAASAFGQGDGGSEPSVVVVEWIVRRQGVPDQVLLNRNATPPLTDKSAITNFLYFDDDTILFRLELWDADWIELPIFPDNPNEDVYLSFQIQGQPVFSPPSTPPVLTATPPAGLFFGPGGSVDNGYKGNTVGAPLPLEVFVNGSFRLPKLSGPSQQRLRGLRDFDAAYAVRFRVSNDQDPEFPPTPPDLRDGTQPNNGEAIEEFNFIEVIRNPSDVTQNPPPFADAGSNQNPVLINTPITLDARRTFDSSNDGFNTDNINVFLRDDLTFAWELLSGPAPVTIVQDSQFSPLAEVSLPVPGEYQFRVLVDDNVSAAPPSAATVTITAVDSLPLQTPPVVPTPTVTPAGTIRVGDTITLDASSAFDPDGAAQTAALTYRWKQTNALGDQLEVQDLLKAFQPLGGVSTKTSSWRAITAGTFYFRVLVSDGILPPVSSELFSVQVVEAQTSGRTASAEGENSSGGESDAVAAVAGATSLCGAGLVSLAAVPLGIFLMRRRIR